MLQLTGSVATGTLVGSDGLVVQPLFLDIPLPGIPDACILLSIGDNAAILLALADEAARTVALGPDADILLDEVADEADKTLEIGPDASAILDIEECN
jgi:hypothetical protein